MSDVSVMQEQIVRLLAEKLSLSVPAPDTELIETGILDSLTFVGLLHELELMFQVRFSLEDLDMDRFRSARHIAEFMAEQTQRTDAHAG